MGNFRWDFRIGRSSSTLPTAAPSLELVLITNRCYEPAALSDCAATALVMFCAGWRRAVASL
jgi:hypothetical protein